MDAVRQTLSFSIINILGTENNDSELQKSPRLSSGMKGDSTLPLSPSSSPDYEISKMDTGKLYMQTTAGETVFTAHVCMQHYRMKIL